MTPLREVFAATKLAQARGYTAARFSLSRPGGRCPSCEGLGKRKIQLGVLPDLSLDCEVCQGLRYNAETLQCQWQGMSIAQVLALTVDEAIGPLSALSGCAAALQLLIDLGLGFLQLGQSLLTLSYGEQQRLRVAVELAGAHKAPPTLYLFDEPCSSLHSVEVAWMAQALYRLIQEGHSVVAVDHNLDLIRQSDYVMELGPGGGPDGGQLIFSGTASELMKQSTPTAKALQEYSSLKVLEKKI